MLNINMRFASKRKQQFYICELFVMSAFKRLSSVHCWKIRAEYKDAGKQHESYSAEQSENRNAMAITITRKTMAIKTVQ